jgi:hypothetical protein
MLLFENQRQEEIARSHALYRSSSQLTMCAVDRLWWSHSQPFVPNGIAPIAAARQQRASAQAAIVRQRAKLGIVLFKSPVD